jgi:hypothetical protein
MELIVLSDRTTSKCQGLECGCEKQTLPLPSGNLETFRWDPPTWQLQNASVIECTSVSPADEAASHLQQGPFSCLCPGTGFPSFDCLIWSSRSPYPLDENHPIRTIGGHWVGDEQNKEGGGDWYLTGLEDRAGNQGRVLPDSISQLLDPMSCEERGFWRGLLMGSLSRGSPSFSLWKKEPLGHFGQAHASLSAQWMCFSNLPGHRQA